MPKPSDLQDSLGSDGVCGDDINDAWTTTHDNQPVCGWLWKVSAESCIIEGQRKRGDWICE